MKERRYEVVEKIYDFDELSDSAKEKARRKYIEAFRENYQFTECCEYRISELFPNSKLEVEYSLSYCQGDGFNICGKMSMKDAVNYVLSKKEFSKNTTRFLKWVSNNGYTLNLPQNGRYGYCCVSHENYIFQIADDLEQDGYTSGEEKAFEYLSDFDEAFKELIETLCNEFEKEGYEYFYEVEDDEIKDIWEANGYEGFYEDGTPCYS